MTDSPGILIIERILRDREGVWQQIADDVDLRSLIGKLLGSAAIALALYGAVLGASNGWLQAAASAVKLPALFMVTLVICLPALYLFNLVFGSRLSIRQALALVSTGINVMALLAVAFAPIALFFIITAPSYQFYKLLNVSILGLTGMVGVSFLVGGMKALNLHAAHITAAQAAPSPARVAEPSGGQPEGTATTAGEPDGQAVATLAPPRVYTGYTRQQADPQRAGSMGLLYIWAIVFAFVGTQLAWTLRPFLGSPDEEFALVRTIDGNFYIDVIRAIGDLLS